MQVKGIIVELVLLAGLTFASNNVFKFEQNVLELFGKKEMQMSKIGSKLEGLESTILRLSDSGHEQAQRQEVARSEENDPPPKCGYQVREGSFNPINLQTSFLFTCQNVTNKFFVQPQPGPG